MFLEQQAIGICDCLFGLVHEGEVNAELSQELADVSGVREERQHSSFVDLDGSFLCFGCRGSRHIGPGRVERRPVFV